MPTRALRVGVLLGGNLVEERVFREGAPITFGQSLRCSISVPGDGIPHEHVLFAREEGRFILRAAPKMTGKLAQRGEINAELVGDVAIDKGARGKLTIGDATLLFQEMAAPPRAPKPLLPASVRGTLGDRIDRRLAAIIGASVIAHLAIAGYAWWNDVESGSMLETPVAQQYRQEVMEVSFPDDPTTPTPSVSTGPGAAAPATPVQTAKPIVRPTRVTPNNPTSTAATEDDAMKFASILAGTEVGRNGANDLSKRQPGADLGTQIAAVGDRQVVVGNNDSGFRQGPRDGIGTDSKQITNDPNQVATQAPKNPEREPGGRIQIKPLPPQGPGTTLTVQMVLDKIKGVYMTGLQRCYKKGLLDDSKLSGKIAMSFTVTERGSLDDASASGVSSEVDACIETLMSGWRFGIPRDKDGDPTEQPFKLVLALQPS
ncbi:MAG: AgmX/PglI C-terminal domain-containing protein [Deltaproteobacteria bacterium]|nr:AgmX/PglI C-terminal domain-containing protein [Deltaproteobacteria bacterium]